MDDILSSIDHFKDTSVLCVGDLMLDLFVYGDVSRISPEAPIPILKATREFYTLGGAGNVVNNLLSLGAKPVILSIIGTDSNSIKLCDLLQEKSINTSHLIRDDSIQTIEKRRFSTKTQQLLRVDYECVGFFDKNLYITLAERAKKILPTVQALILSDYGKGTLHPDLVITPLISEAKKHKIPIITDPKGIDYSIYKGSTVITPNRKELREATNLPTSTDKEIISAATKILTECGIENVLATRSEDGMTLVKNNGEAHHYKTQAREVYDVSGAGDTVVAVMGAALGAGAPLQDSCYLSNIAGSIVVGKIGTATVSDSELKQYCTEKTLDDEDKLMPMGMLLEKIKVWHQKGFKVGFTNGCFDLLHQGHMKILKESKEACDKLIVAINSDASVRRLKGPERPINDEKTRASIISCLKFVDAVLIFEEDTPLEIIQELCPDVLIKGADYSIDKVVGGDFVQKKGGKVLLVELEPGRSSTAIIGKILK
jgi:D-beta-D-heptose 7-phosphate kinase/D-beta-D-heptose 1-phosphate adenosyltransferase